MPKILIENWGDLLMCNVSGNPVPRLIWYIDGEFIKENKNEETSLTVKKVLDIINVLLRMFLGILRLLFTCLQVSEILLTSTVLYFCQHY